MQYFSVPRFLALSMILGALALSCSHHSGSPVVPGDLENPRTLTGGTILLGASVQDGADLLIPIEFQGCQDVYAASLRVAFDPASLSPAGVEWDQSFSEGFATFSVTDQPGIVPLAFTNVESVRALSGSGTLCTLRFTMLDGRTDSIRIVNDPAYLVAYNELHDRLTLNVGGES